MEIFTDQSIKATIQVPSGKLVIANYFDNDLIYQMQGDDKYGKPSINSILGRIKLTRYLESLNVGYGQMGNMSMYVHMNEKGTRIVFNGDENYRAGYKCYGEISLSVWRWQCADLDTLKQYNQKIDANEKESTNYHDQIMLNVKSGAWLIKHYYDLGNGSKYRYTVLTLKNETN